ncbi:MAG: nickel pincer cofactor biosynthesis protein LarB [Actinobacteria bacterium]|nr:nickel pincer cofactor biosynthesis protein LarB [Actinomycetota bacterium]
MTDEVSQRRPHLDVAHVGEFARLDIGRSTRRGVPEVIYAPGKSPSQFLAIVQAFVHEKGLALASRVDEERRRPVENWAADENLHLWIGQAGAMEVVRADYQVPRGAGLVGILTAGTSDLAVAEEAELVARHMGCRVLTAQDVGVAGVHRLLVPLTEMLDADVDVIVVAAGMEGALASVVAGLVTVPVIGLPVSAGYGLGGKGVAALYSMLQSCSSGLVVVNIDNGVGAGAAAGLIAGRAARSAEKSGADDQ